MDDEPGGGSEKGRMVDTKGGAASKEDSWRDETDGAEFTLIVLPSTSRVDIVLTANVVVSLGTCVDR